MEKKNAVPTGKKLFLDALTEIADYLDDVIDWDQIDPANPAPAPEIDPQSWETVVGTLTDNQKILWTVLEAVTEKLKEAEDGTPFMGELNEARELLKCLLFYHCNKHFGSYDSSRASGIRSGYRFAVSKSSSETEFYQALANLTILQLLSNNDD